MMNLQIFVFLFSLLLLTKVLDYDVYCTCISTVTLVNKAVIHYRKVSRTLNCRSTAESTVVKCRSLDKVHYCQFKSPSVEMLKVSNDPSGSLYKPLYSLAKSKLSERRLRTVFEIWLLKFWTVKLFVNDLLF